MEVIDLETAEASHDCEHNNTCTHDELISTMGWKVVSKIHGRPPRTRYVAPNGKAFQSIREFCELLMEQEGAKTEVIPNKQSINNEGATDAQKFGKWGFRKPRNKSLKSRNNSSYNLHIGLLNKSSPVLDYYNSLYGKAGRRKDNAQHNCKQEDVELEHSFTEIAVEHQTAHTHKEITSNVMQCIAAMGWKVESKSHGRPPRTKYTAPNGKVFYSIEKVFNYLKEQEGLPREEKIRSPPQVKIESKRRESVGSNF
ncbi:hypothetical protein QJS10_CPB20g00293 [Acorus calamus]|uniref:DUF7028 domain-containing protein n=1 Tax=Acorus calamus TaxID=4465 RepID=A0AAV9CCM7_ACOCL|nr:hypothetical protein QJS10_CPB20g00293 [Acorus calamus]